MLASVPTIPFFGEGGGGNGPFCTRHFMLGPWGVLANHMNKSRRFRVSKKMQLLQLYMSASSFMT